MVEANEAELARLDKLISELQWQIFNAGGFQAASTSMLVKRLSEVQSRSTWAHHDEQHEKDKKVQSEQREQSIAIAKAECELALTLSEQREYASLLTCEFFTRSMFPRLDGFYNNTWDRLSEGGKAEMSKRVWESVRQGQYKFHELPDSVKDKEAKQVACYLTHDSTKGFFANEIKEADRNEFLKAHAAGCKAESYQVLDRPEFARAVANCDAKQLAAAIQRRGKEVDARPAASPLASSNVASTAKSSPSPGLGSMELDDVLNDIKAVQALPAQSASSFPKPQTERRR